MIISRTKRVLANYLKINAKLIFRLSLFIPLALLFSFISKPDDSPVDKLLSQLQRWTDTIPQEKIYLHMDKPYYALGDTIWFKGYITIGSRHQLSALSGAVYVDLINERDSIVKALKLPLTSGMIMGDFVLADDYKQGSYRLRAYTQWMRNAGPEYFFDHTFTVGDLMSQNLVAKADYQYKTVDGKQVLTALLHFTDDEGRALGERSLRYHIVINKKTVWQQNIKTDVLGSASITIQDADKANLKGAYIRTSIDGSGGYTIYRDFPIKAEKAQTDVQFFPEGGNLVNGISSKIAFKAIGVDGLGVTIKGSIIDESGAELNQFATLHAGMGTFLLRPATGKSYSAKVTLADGSTQTIALPKAVDEGYALSVYQPNKDSVLVRISASAGLLAQPQSVNLIAQTGGESIFASPVKIQKAITSVWMDKKSFPSGIAQFTLFDNTGQPICERIAFIRSKDLMELEIKTAKDSYKSKEPIKIDLGAKDSKGKATAGNFSVTVIDEGKMPIEESKESTIFSNILLTSDLKGYIERPNYYFTKESDEVNRALDNLMLTQGYRRFSWKELPATIQTKPKFEVEGLGTKITGRVTNLSNKPLPNANVTLISVIAGVTLFTTTDSVGRFKFDGIFMTDSIKYTLQARGAKNTDKVKILLDKVPEQIMTPNPNLGDVSTNISGTLKEYIDNGKKLDDVYEKYGMLDKVHRLREVRIKARKPAPPPYSNQGIKIPEGLSDQTIIMNPDDTIKTALRDWLPHMLKAVQFKPYGDIPIYPYARDLSKNPYPLVPLKLYVDGRLVDYEETKEVLEGFQIQPEGIYKIEIVRTTTALLGMLNGPSIMIFTKRDYVRRNYTPSIANVTPKGFNKVREFYQPRYDRPGLANLPDLRTTIYWNPYLKTDTTGNTAFNFFNADGPGNYKVIVEGINADGELGRQVFRYTVEAGEPYTPTTALFTPDKNLAAITAPLDSFNKRLPTEKVYLHTDKPYYNLGDTLWFKSYVTDRNLIGSKKSGLLYVELIDDSMTVARRISIPIKDGLAWAQIPLPKTIFHEGAYTLRAYTNWMQNFGDETFYSQRLHLGMAAERSWLVKSEANINRVNDRDILTLDLKLNRPDDLLSPVALRKVEVKIMELRTDLHDFQRWIYREKLQTGLDGSLKISQQLKEKLNGRRVRMEITDLEAKDEFKRVKLPLLLNRNQNIDLQFLPEGGYMVAGIKSVIGFKALDEEGMGISASGSIVDSLGNKAGTFTTLHNGMGSFEFTPAKGKSYFAKLDLPGNKKYPLPKARATGTVMHIDNPEQTERINITLAGLDALGTDADCYLIGATRGGVYFSQKIEVNQPELIVNKKQFPTGIARFTLFKGKRPVMERRVFIDNHDQLSINIKPGKTNYSLRDSVGLEIEVKNKLGVPVQGSFSLAVTDDSQVKPDNTGNNGIMAGLLINTEIKGNVESPGYYINRKDKNAWQALDNLMLTQGWTAYDWADVFVPAKEPAFEAEKAFKITGTVTRLGNKPAINTPVVLSSQKPSFVTTAVTDSLGRYEFRGLPTIDSGSFFIQANNTKGKNAISLEVRVDRFKGPKVPETSSDPLLPWYVNADTTQINYVKRQTQLAHEEELKLTGNVLKEVKIKSKKILKEGWLKEKADLAFDEQDIKESTTTNLYELLKQKIPGFKIIKDWRYRQGRITAKIGDERFIDWPDLKMDGAPVMALLHIDDPNSLEELIDEMSQFKIQNFKSLEVGWNGKYFPQIKRWRGFSYYHAVVVIETLNKTGWINRFKPGTTSYRPLPLMYPQQFYSPKYTATSVNTGSDLRATLFWEPNIFTDQNGKAKVSFYTSDIKSTFTVKMAGISSNGDIGDATIKLNDSKPLQ